MNRPKLFGCFLIFLAAFLSFSTPSARAEGELLSAIKSREAFINSKEKKERRSEWLKLIKEFEDAAMAQYNPRHASRSRYLGAGLAFDSALKFKQKDDYDTAANLAKRAVRDCPQCPHSPDAQLIYGRALMARDRLDQAVKELMKVELNYPDSPEVAKARKHLAKLRGGPPPEPEKKVVLNEASKNPGRQISSGSAESSGKIPKTQAPTGAKDTPEQSPQSKAQASLKPGYPPQPSARVDGKAQVYGLELWDRGEYTQVTAYVDQVTPYVYNLIPPSRNGGSFRVYADLKNSVISPKAKLQLPSGNNLIKLVKMNQFNEDVVRVVFDMPEACPYRPTFLNDPPRFVFQVAKEASKLPAQMAEAQPDPPEEKAPQVAPEKESPARPVKGPDESLARQLGLKIKTVVIDPGHGGKDLGTSKNGLIEKNIVLDLSKKLAQKIEKRLDVKVFLTREDDRFITLSRRVKIAKEKKADLFISLHVNANDLPEVEGFETYVLNFATDRSAMSVAARENAQSDKNMAELQDILDIIARNTKIAESRAMAQILHKAAVTNINKKYKTRDLGVKEAPFYVLVGTEAPSILVEVGFITNAKNAALLNQDAYLDSVAEGLSQGLENYVKGF